MVFPGRLQWSVDRLPVLVGLVSAQVRIDGMPQPLRIEGSLRELRISAGSLDLPRVQLEALGSPWNTVRPAATVMLRWDAATIGSTGLQARLVAELRDVSSALTAVRPLGSYRIELNTREGQGDLTLSTLDGALKLSGRGRWSARGLSVTAEAQPAQPDDPRLQGVLSLIGRREGDRTVIRIGA
jgi:general secretion pathway protein N